MSSKAKKIVKEVQAEERAKRYYVMGTLAGSAALSIGKLAGKTEKEIIEGFDKIKDKNITSRTDYYIDLYNHLGIFLQTIYIHIYNLSKSYH